jgi:two-component system NarL family sensor kinase
MVGTVRDITELREAELAARQAQHQGMVARDQERRRLAADLHDSLGQGLVLLRLKLQRTLEDGAGALDEAQMRELADTIRTCGQLVQEVRGLCQGLYPPTLESLGLPAALRGLARDFAGSADVTIDCPAHLENQRLKGEQEIALFRIAQEALQNAVRHGRAHHVQVRLTRRHGQVRMCVSDDGAGFDTRQMSKGLGLRVMAERAKSLGGQLTVGSEKRNTRVCVEIPLGGQVRSKNKENTKITKITKDTKKARKRRKLTTGKE